MLILKKDDPNIVTTPDATRATLYINTDEWLSIRQSNGYVQLLTFTNPNFYGNVNTTGNMLVSGFANIQGNVTVGNLIGPVANGVTNLNIPVAAGNINMSVGGTSNVLVVTSTGANITGTANVVGNANISNLGVSGQVITTGNVVGGNLITGGNLQVTGNANITGAVLITGNLTVQGNITYNEANYLYVTDPIIEQGGGPNGAPLTSNDGKDRGQLLHYYTTQPIDAFMGWDNSNAEFSFGSNVSMSSEVISFNQLGNVRAGNFVGTLANGTSNVSVLLNGNIVTTIAGNPRLTVTGTGANVTGTANITGNTAIGFNLDVVGNITGANIQGPLANGTSNVRIATTNGNVGVSVNGNANILVVSGTGANVTGTANITGNTSIGSNLVVTANVTAANLQGPLANGTSNVSMPSVNGNITMNVGGTSNVVVVSATGANVTGTANISGNTAIGANLVVTANVTAANLVGRLANGNTGITIPAADGNLNVSVSGNANIVTVTGTGANIAGTLNATGNAVVANLATAALGQVTIGNVTITASGISTAGAVANVFNANATTVNIGGAATTINMGTTGGITNITSNLQVANIVQVGTVAGTGNVLVSGFVVGNTSYYANGSGGNFAIGYREVPQVVASANITLGLTDSGKHIYASNQPARTVTIPANNTVPLPIGTAVSIVQSGANAVTVVPASGVTLRLAGASTATGNRTITGGGLASLIKVEANVWYISGTGVS